MPQSASREPWRQRSRSSSPTGLPTWSRRWAIVCVTARPSVSVASPTNWWPRSWPITASPEPPGRNPMACSTAAGCDCSRARAPQVWFSRVATPRSVWPRRCSTGSAPGACSPSPHRRGRPFARYSAVAYTRRLCTASHTSFPSRPSRSCAGTSRAGRWDSPCHPSSGVARSRRYCAAACQLRSATRQPPASRHSNARGSPPGSETLPPGPQATGHLDAARVAATLGGAAVTTEGAARIFDLRFLRLEDHVVEVWVNERWLAHPGINALGEVLATTAFTERVAHFGGYDLTHCGEPRRHAVGTGTARSAPSLPPATQILGTRCHRFAVYWIDPDPRSRG